MPSPKIACSICDNHAVCVDPMDNPLCESCMVLDSEESETPQYDYIWYDDNLGFLPNEMEIE